MNLPDLKALKKLADACRKAGIKHYKSPDFEFTLTDDAPVSSYHKRQSKSITDQNATNGEFETDTLSQDALLFWSTQDDTDVKDDPSEGI